MTRKEQIEQAATESCQHLPEFKIYFEMGAEWADKNPHWISVEDELPKENGAYLFHFDDGQTRVEGYFPKLHLSKCVTHWMPLPEAPRKEE